MRPSLITGIGGQDGAYLAALLRARGRRVVGTVRPGDAPPPYAGEAVLATHDVRDAPGFARLLERYEPAEIYNLAAFTSVGASWEAAELVEATNGDAVVAMLAELVRFRELHGWAPRFCQASTADQYGAPSDAARDETTPMQPRSPYAKAKLRAHLAVAAARTEQDLFACSAILFNHESPLRPPHFVTRKITRAAASIALGLAETVTLGNLDVRRDWGAAADVARALALMTGAESPDDYVVATGVSRPLRELVELSFAAAGVTEPWSRVLQDPALMRPIDVPDLRGDASKIHHRLGWSPSVPFSDVIARMVEVDLLRLRTGREDDPAYL